MGEQVTTAELYRLVQSMRTEQGEHLKEIRRQTTATNGRVNRAEQKLLDHDREFKELKAAVRVPVAAVADGTRKSSADDPATVSLAISAKMWALLASVAAGAGVAMPTLIKIIEKWLGL